MSANSSKANDPRFWSLWKRSGSVVHNINVPEPTGGTHIKEYGDTLVEIFKSCYSNNFWRKKGQIQIVGSFNGVKLRVKRKSTAMSIVSDYHEQRRREYE